MNKIKCVVCGREKMFANEGHFIDGSWLADRDLLPKYENKWVCSYSCFEKLLKKTRKEMMNNDKH